MHPMAYLQQEITATQMTTDPSICLLLVVAYMKLLHVIKTNKRSIIQFMSSYSQLINPHVQSYEPNFLNEVTNH